MNAHALISEFRTGHTTDKKPAKDFPPEAYTYDDRIDPDVVAAIQAESNKKIEQQEWTVIATIEDVLER